MFLKDGDVVEVNSDTQANVTLMDDSDYFQLQSGSVPSLLRWFLHSFSRAFGSATLGYWNVVMDLGGGQATVRHSMRVISRAL